MNTLIITKLSGHASFQDLGRESAQHLGFSGSGAADEYSFRLANKLLKNHSSAPALEITMGQISLKAESTCRLVITGADCRATISRNEYIDDESFRPVSIVHVFILNKGETLSLQTPQSQLHSYIAIEGGFHCQQWLGSVSQAVNERALGFGEASLSLMSTLYFRSHSVDSSPPLQKNSGTHFHQQGKLTLRFLPSQLWLSLTEHEQKQLLQQVFTVSANSNRMGYRLSGKGIALDIKQTSLSKPVCFGTIQLPSDGHPIVLMKDRQTIGGYPTLGTVIQTDLFRLSQKRAGEQVDFVPTTLNQAQAQLLAFQQNFEQE